MNRQNPPHGIEWTRINGMPGYTWNPTGGCLHGCTWKMPDGSLTECYAKTVAEGLARAAYPQGFEHHYWRPDALEQPLRLRFPAGIFVGSMADLFGHWVPQEQIEAVIRVMRDAHWHTFQTLSKYPLRVIDFSDLLPENVWAGISLPAGHRMPIQGAKRALAFYLGHMEKIRPLRFMSIEPLWFDVAETMHRHAQEHGRLPFEWAIIGAASKGRTVYQPDPGHVSRLLYVLDMYGVPVFFKGNMNWSPWREEFPEKEGAGK